MPNPGENPGSPRVRRVPVSGDHGVHQRDTDAAGREGGRAISTITIKDGPVSGSATPAGVELRHLRYFVAVADAGTFTHAAELMFITQPTLSQQIRRLEEMVGTPLLRRAREGVRLTRAGTVFLEECRAVLSLVDHGLSRTRQTAGLGRPRLRFAVQPFVPEDLAVDVAARLRRTAAAAEVDVAWIEAPLDGEFTLVRERRADAGLGWLADATADPPAGLEVMNLGKFEPDVWLPGTAHAAPAPVIGLRELAAMEVIHSARCVGPVTYDAWLSVLRAVNPRFGFTDPPLRRSVPVTLALAASASRYTAVLSGPRRRVSDGPDPAQLDSAQLDPAQPDREGASAGMVRARIEGSPLTAAAALAWSEDLPDQLQQVLFDAADRIAC
jgi:LysR family transcriptional regulator, benzoate and cis,cis-muconate-responsive activator of ben and cat genes